MKNKKQNLSVSTDTVEDGTVVAEKEVQRPGILKSALKRGSKKYSRKKHRVQFNENLNKFFEADYVILVRDDEYDDDEDLEDAEYGQCECGNQFCYEGCYYPEDVEEDGDYGPEYHRHPSSVDSPRYDFAAAFDPPFEFVDPVTLSPPDGYKDAGCGPDPSHAMGPNKVSASTMTSHDGTRNENRGKSRNESNASFSEKTKMLQQQQQEQIDDASGAKKDQRNQGYVYHHPNEVGTSGQVAVFDGNAAPVGIGGSQSRYIVETITMTTVTERRIVRESNDQMTIGDMLPPDSSKYNSSGILKGGKSWRSEANSKSTVDSDIPNLISNANSTGINDRGIKFEDPASEDSCDKNENEKGEFTLTFKLGNRVVPCNSLKPNSAVRQLFPDPRFADLPTATQPGCEAECDLGKCEGKYLVTEESLRAFNEVNRRSVFATFGGKERYPYKDTNFAVNSDDEDIPQNDLIKKTIERNTLRRSLMRYPRGKHQRAKKKAEPSLEERIKQLTCNIDDEQSTDDTGQGVSMGECAVMPPRSSPPGEESHSRQEIGGPSIIFPASTGTNIASKPEKSAYKKFTDLFRNKSDNQQAPTAEQPYAYYQPVYQAAQPDLGIDMKIHGATLIMAKKSAGPNESRKQFLSSLAPLTACVTGHVEPNYGNRETLKLKLAGDRGSIISTTSTGTEYSMGDLDEASSKLDEKAPQPDVVAGTPNADPSQDELAMFVQQDAGRIERIKKRYNSASAAAMVADDDEHDDYGFSRRPSVRSIKPRFGSTTEILQQMQAHLQPPLLACTTKPGSHMTWPYYSTECADAAKNDTSSPRNSLPTLKEEATATAEYTAKLVWEKSASTSTLPPRIAGIAPQPPLKIDAAAPCGNVHMFRLTPSDPLAEMVMPYGKGDGCTDPRRLAGNGNIFQMKVSPVGSVVNAGTASTTQVRLPINVTDGTQFASAHPIQVGTTSVIRVGHGQQQTFRVPCPVGGPVQVHLLATHHHHYESPPPQVRCTPSSQPVLHAHPVHPAIPYPASALPLSHHHPPQQIVLAKGTQTSTISSTTSFYQLQTNAPMGTGYPTTMAATSAVTAAACKGSTSSAVGEPAKLIQLNYAVAHQSAVAPIATLNSSPTRLKAHNQLAERGIPEGAVSTADGPDNVKPMSQPSTAESAPAVPPKGTTAASSATASTVPYGMKV